MKSTIAIDESLIQTEMKYWKVPGLSVSIVKEGALPYAKGFGVRNDTSQPVDAHTQFCIASCSKAMTSAIIAMLVSQGKLSYDTPIRKYLPAFTLVDAKASEKVTLRDLLCHRSGLGGHDGIWPVKENLSQFTSRFKFLQPSAPYGTKAQYSNIMYGLAGHVAEVVTGKDWNSLVHEYLFAPLSMSESSCQAAQLISASNHADPYQVINGKLTALPVWNVDTVAPAASVNTTAQDMQMTRQKKKKKQFRSS